MDSGKQDLSAGAAPPPYSGYGVPPPAQYPPSNQQPAYPPSNQQPAYPPSNQQPAYPPSSGYGQPAQYQQGYGYQPTTSSFAQNSQTTVIMAQPGGFAPAAPAMMVAPPNHMALSIITCLFCFWPISVVAIIKSNEVDNAVSRGDLVGANAASASARKLSMISIGIGVCCYILLVVIIIIQVSAAAATYRY